MNSDERTSRQAKGRDAKTRRRAAAHAHVTAKPAETETAARNADSREASQEMSARGIALFAVAVSALLAAWLFRYEIVPVPAGGQGSISYAYKLDRWTGAVLLLHRDDARTVVKEEP